MLINPLHFALVYRHRPRRLATVCIVQQSESLLEIQKMTIPMNVKRIWVKYAIEVVRLVLVSQSNLARHHAALHVQTLSLRRGESVTLCEGVVTWGGKS